MILTDSQSFPQQQAPKSFEEILKNDDAEALQSRLRSRPGLPNIVYFQLPYRGELCSFGSVASAIHYRAERCLRHIPTTPETWGSKRGGPTAAHVACLECWQPGIDHLVAAQVPFHVFDSFHHTPLSYVADNKDVRAFQTLLDYFCRNAQRSSVKNVFNDPISGSVDLLSYCVKTQNKIIINCCQRARDLGLLDDGTIERACDQWEREGEGPPPRFLRVFRQSRRLEADVSMSALFSPLVSVTRFAPIDSKCSFPIRPTVQAIDELNRLVRGMRTHDWVAPQDPRDSELVAFLEADGFAPYNYTPRTIIKRYFDEVLVRVGRGYLMPRADDPHSWEGLGMVLAHVGAMGCHCLLERPLDPLLWAAIRGDRLSDYSPELIEEYLLETDQDWLGSRRVEATRQFHKGDSGCVECYRHALLAHWREHISPMLPICEAISRGFGRLTVAKASDKKLL
jgi:hypothetical protein